MTEAVTAVVVNWNGRPYLGPCLSSLMAQSYPCLQVVLVDNGSQDGSLQYVQSAFPEVQVISNQKNVGFATATNQAIAATDTPYIALLNNDAVAERHWLEHLVAAIEGHPRVGACASKMLFLHKPTIINSTGIAVDVAGIAWDRKGGQADGEEDEAVMEVFGACGGAALYRQAMLTDVGAFDEDFFAYLEDVDLAWRARLRGWRCLYVPQARVYHLHSATGGEGSPVKSSLLGRNKLWAIAKNYPWPHLLWFLPAIALFDGLAVAYALLHGDAHPLWGRWQGLKGLPRMWPKRRAIQRRRLMPFQQLGLLPLEAPWRVAGRYRHLARRRRGVKQVMGVERDFGQGDVQ